MPRIALLTRYDSKGASSRVRTLQYLPTLHAAGIETEHFPLFGNDYLESLYHGENTTGLRIRALLNRIFSMRSITRKGRFDLLWIEKELLPYLPYGLEKWLLRRGVPYMLDFDDAIFHNYDQSSNSNRLREVAALRGVDAYMVDNAGYLRREWFEGKNKVGITAGASAPEVLVKEVLQTIQEWGHETIREGEGAEESIVFVLPKELRREGENKQALNKG